jgi:hypothetical protein
MGLKSFKSGPNVCNQQVLLFPNEICISMTNGRRSRSMLGPNSAFIQGWPAWRWSPWPMAKESLDPDCSNDAWPKMVVVLCFRVSLFSKLLYDCYIFVIIAWRRKSVFYYYYFYKWWRPFNTVTNDLLSTNPSFFFWLGILVHLCIFIYKNL